jgi:predicted SprT family Zn-dependent metalloprotease
MLCLPQQSKNKSNGGIMAYTRHIDILKSCSTKIINYNLIKRGEVDIIRLAIIDCLSMYNMENSDDFIIESVEISKRLATTAGKCSWTFGSKKVFKIKLAYNNYIEFGSESMIKTLRHEMAHLIEAVIYGKNGHSEKFKRICVKLGGHMNKQLAGSRYEENATSDYCKPKKKIGKTSYKYTCSCGMSFTRKRIINNPNTLRAVCKTCRTIVTNMKLEVI